MKEILIEFIILVTILIVLYTTCYFNIKNKEKNFFLYFLKTANLIFILMFTLYLFIFNSKDVSIMSFMYKIIFSIENFYIASIYLFVLKLCKKQFLITFEYVLYILIIPIINIIYIILDGADDVIYLSIYRNFSLSGAFIYIENVIFYLNMFFIIGILVYTIITLVNYIKNAEAKEKKYLRMITISIIALAIYELLRLFGFISVKELLLVEIIAILILNITVYNYFKKSIYLLDNFYNMSICSPMVSIDINDNIITYNKEFKSYILEDRNCKKLNHVLETFDFINLEELELKDTIIKSKEQEIFYNMKRKPIIGNKKEIQGYLVEFFEISYTAKTLDEINFKLNYDMLTGTSTRRFFYKKIEQLENEKFLPCAYLFCDINNLKKVNDEFGHKIGDEYLLNNVEAIKSAVPKDSIISRFGGDEFVIVIANCDDELAKNIIMKIETKNDDESLKAYDRISISIGYRIRNSLMQSCDSIIAEADGNMYTNKRKRQARVSNRDYDV